MQTLGYPWRRLVRGGVAARYDDLCNVNLRNAAALAGAQPPGRTLCVAGLPRAAADGLWGQAAPWLRRGAAAVVAGQGPEAGAGAGQVAGLSKRAHHPHSWPQPRLYRRPRELGSHLHISASEALLVPSVQHPAGEVLPHVVGTAILGLCVCPACIPRCGNDRGASARCHCGWLVHLEVLRGGVIHVGGRPERVVGHHAKVAPGL